MPHTIEESRLLSKGLDHPWVHVSYECDGHTHIVSGCGKEPGESFGEYLEDVGNELAEAVLRCNPSRHKGHGVSHDISHAEKAFKAAVQQLLTRDYHAEYTDLLKKIRNYKMWGDKQPADLVFQPNPEDPNDWLMFVKHPETGLPTVYNTGNVLELPPPDPKRYHQGKYNFYRKGK